MNNLNSCTHIRWVSPFQVRTLKLAEATQSAPGGAHHSSVGQGIDSADNILARPRLGILQPPVLLCKAVDARVSPGQPPQRCPIHPVLAGAGHIDGGVSGDLGVLDGETEVQNGKTTCLR